MSAYFKHLELSFLWYVSLSVYYISCKVLKTHFHRNEQYSILLSMLMLALKQMVGTVFVPSTKPDVFVCRALDLEMEGWN